MASIVVRLVAMGWSIAVWRRLKDDRMAFLTVMFGLMALRQILMLEGRSGVHLGHAEELPSLAVSVMAVLAVVFLARMLTERRAREGELERVFQLLPDLYVRVDARGTIVDYRASRRGDLAIPAETRLGRHPRDVLPPAAAALFEEHFARAVASGEVETWETSLSMGGGTRVFESRMSALPEGGAISIVRDVTQRREAERALRDSEARLRLLTEQIPAILWTTDADLRITSSTGAGLRALGLAPEQTTGTMLADYLGTRDPDHPVLKGHRRALAGESVTDETEWQGRTFQRHMEPLRDAAGRVVGVLGLALDISARRAAEESLEEAHRIARLGRWSWDAVRDDVAWSDEMLGMFGVPRGDEPRSAGGFLEIVHPDDRADTAARLASLSRGAPVYRAEHRVLRPDGSVRHLVCEGRPARDDDGTLRRLDGQSSDVRDRRRAGEGLRASRPTLRNLALRSQKVREEERAAVAREIHDELGQSLTGMKMDLVWLAERPDHVDTPQRVQSLLRLVDSTLDAMRELAGRLRPAMLDHLGLEAALESMARDMARRAGIGCRLKLEAADVPRDEERDTAIYRIAQEALTNVVRHAGAGAVRLRLRPDGDTLALRVEDDGRGIRPGELKNPGSLGLAGMKERARALGGTVRVRRARTGGTVVVCRMPLRRGAGEPQFTT